MLACTVLTLNITILSGFNQIYPVPVMLVTGILLCGLYGIFVKNENQSWFYLSILAISLIFVLIFRQSILEGFRLFWNQQGDYRTLGTGSVVSEFETLFSADRSGRALFCFSMLAGIFCAIICCCLTNFMSVLLLLVLMAEMLYFGIDASYQYLPVTLAAAVVSLIGGMKIKKSAFGTVSRSWGLCIVMAMILFAVASNQKIEQFVLRTSEQVHQFFHEKKYETKFTTLPEGKFSAYKETEAPVQALSVTMEKPEAMYLRGFTGEIFENGSWRALDTECLAESEDLLYWLNLNLFSSDTQFAAAAKEMDMETNQITIQNVGACNQYLYVPFGLQNGDYLEPKDINQSGVLSTKERTYSYSVVSDEIQMMPVVLERLQNSEEAYVDEYRKAETAYRAFIYKNYLEVPLDEVAPLVKQWEKILGNYSENEALTLEEAQECTMIFLSRCFSEEGVPADITLPLANLSGSSYQYATVAVLTARYFGLPARYAEGYVITEDLANSTESGASMKVDSSYSSAWVEVYQDGIGWIPMNLIPGLGELTEEKIDSSDQKGLQASDGAELLEDLEELTGEKKETEEPDNGFATAVREILHWGILLVVIVCVLLLLILVIRRKVILNRRNEKHENTNTKDAVTWIFADTIQLLEVMKINRRNGSLEHLVCPICEKFGRSYGEQFEKMMVLNATALFSSHEVMEEQRTAALDFYHQTITFLKKNLSLFEKLWCKWIQCLY